MQCDWGHKLFLLVPDSEFGIKRHNLVCKCYHLISGPKLLSLHKAMLHHMDLPGCISLSVGPFTSCSMMWSSSVEIQSWFGGWLLVEEPAPCGGRTTFWCEKGLWHPWEHAGFPLKYKMALVATTLWEATGLLKALFVCFEEAFIVMSGFSSQLRGWKTKVCWRVSQHKEILQQVKVFIQKYLFNVIAVDTWKTLLLSFWVLHN